MARSPHSGRSLNLRGAWRVGEVLSAGFLRVPSYAAQAPSLRAGCCWGPAARSLRAFLRGWEGSFAGLSLCLPRFPVQAPWQSFVAMGSSH